MNKNIELREIFIDSLNSQGQGVGRDNGKVVFITGAVPGDKVLIKITFENKKYSVGKIVKVILPSESRINPPCELANHCGGCSLQFMDYEKQLKVKNDTVIEAFVRVGGFERKDIINAAEKIVTAKQNFYYRNKVQIPVAGNYENPQIGFYESDSHNIVDGDLCIVQHPAADIVRREVRDFIVKSKIEPFDEKSGNGLLKHIVVRVGYRTNQVMVILVVKEFRVKMYDALISKIEEKLQKESLVLESFYINVNEKITNVVLGDEFILLAGSEKIKEVLCDNSYLISPGAFFQVNTLQAEVLFEKVLEYADPKDQDIIFDLYCGTGSISLLLAKKCKKVYGIEIFQEAINDAKENMKINGITNTEFIAGKSEDEYPRLTREGIRAETVVLDPPRKGVQKELLEVILNNSPEKIVYVSCNPATLARDCKILCETGKYKITKFVPVDMFPWTGHVECVVLMQRK